jgi:hypothetical protein
MPQFSNPSAQELEEIRRYIEDADELDVISEDIRRLVESHWPWLLSKLPPQNEK